MPMIASLLAIVTTAHAGDSPPEIGDAASDLFYEARALIKQGRYEIACKKLEESLVLDYGIGTEFNLADCNERLGKLSTAWSGFVRVAAAAKARKQLEREKVANERARKLSPRVPKLLIEVSRPAPAGLEISCDGVVLGADSWGVPVPVDPGLHRVDASAPGMNPWQGAARAREGAVVRVALPHDLGGVKVLAPPIAAGAPTTSPSTPTTSPATHEVRSRRADFPKPIVERGASTQRTLGWVSGGLGLAGIGLGAAFAFDSLQKREQAGDHCAGDRCDAQGVSLRDGAIASGDVATIATAAGGAALLGSVVLLLTAPRAASHKSHATTSPSSFRAFPHVAANGGGLWIQGNVP